MHRMHAKLMSHKLPFASRLTFGRSKGIHFFHQYRHVCECTQIAFSLSTGSGRSSLMTNAGEILLRMSDLNR